MENPSRAEFYSLTHNQLREQLTANLQWSLVLIKLPDKVLYITK